MNKYTLDSIFDFFCSWSGGKDSCLSLFRMIQNGHNCIGLFTMLDETGNRSRSHGLHTDLIIAQSKMMNLPLLTGSSFWSNYEDVFKENLNHLKKSGIMNGVFGDIDLEPHREWVERVCNETGFKAHLPLWLENRRSLVTEFIDAGFKAVIVAVNTLKMSPEFLGRQLDHQLIDELESIGIDSCGENGEYHTFVFDGPLFIKPINFFMEATINKDEYCFLKLAKSSGN